MAGGQAVTIFFLRKQAKKTKKNNSGSKRHVCETFINKQKGKLENEGTDQ